MRRATALFLALAFASTFAPRATAAGAAEGVVLLLFDGFAPALVTHNATPALDRMAETGVSSHGLVPAFPTISLINGVTVSTGCWPARHGIVTNVFRDPERGRYDHSRDADWLLDCEHLHQAAERQGVRSAALAWYGSHSASLGAQASFVEEDPGETCGEDALARDAARGKEVERLLALPPGGRPRLVLAYFCGPDSAAHFHGLESEEAQRAVAASDGILAGILAAAEERGDVTVLVTTDHGMTPVRSIVNVKRILGRHDIAATPLSTGTTSFLYFDDPADVAPAVEKLSGYEEFEVLRKDDLPDYAHLGAGPRVPELILSARPPYFVEDLELWPSWLRWLGSVGPDFIWARPFLKATHGYPPDTPGMHGILYAWGPGIARGRRVPRVRNIDVHPTVAALLGIEPGWPLDGHVEPALLAAPPAVTP